MRNRAVVLVSVLLAAATAGPVAAQEPTAPVTVGTTGGAPEVAVDAEGRAHVAWNSTAPGDHRTIFCRVPRGSRGPAAGCGDPQSFPAPGTAGVFDRPHVLLASGNRVIVVRRTCCAPNRVGAFTSIDTGLTFGAESALAEDGPQSPVSLAGDAVFGPGERISWVDGVGFQSAPVIGPPVTQAAVLFGPVGGSSALWVSGVNARFAGDGGGGPLRYRDLDVPAAPNLAASWSAPTPLPAASDGQHDVRAATAGGHQAIAWREKIAGVDRLVMAGSATGGSVSVIDDNAPGNFDLFGGDGGTLDAVWTPPGSGTIHWRRSTDGGATWSPRVTILLGENSITSVRGATAPDGQGWVSYRTLAGLVRLVPLEAFVAPPAPPAPPGPPAPPAPVPTCGTTIHPAKLEVQRARVLRADRRLDVLAPITGRASGNVRVAFQAAGRTERFTATVDSRNRRVRINRRIPESQARLGTGILTLTYRGDADTQPQEVRLRAASRRADLEAGRPRLTVDRLTASGRISTRARGVVRVQLVYTPLGGSPTTIERSATIRDGRYSLDTRLPAEVVAGITTRCGVLHSYTLFTGYGPQNMRGEMKSFQVLGAR